MQNNRFKLAIPLGTIAIGASTSPSWTNIPSFNLDSLFGGGFHVLKIYSDNVLGSKSLDLNSEKIKNLGQKDYSGNITSNLEVQKVDFLDSETFKSKLTTEESSQSVTSIYSEVKKEEKVNNIDRKAESKVSELRKRLNRNEHSQFNSALKKVRSFKGETSSIIPRSKAPRSNNTQIQKLSEVEKRSISNFFDKFRELEEEKTKSLNQLESSTQEKKDVKTQNSIYLKEIPGNLRTIGWTAPELNIFHKKSRFRKSPINQHQYYSDDVPFEVDQAKQTWGDWNRSSHPYRHFFDSESDWLDSVGEISNVWKAYYGTMNNRGRRFCAVTSFVLPIGNLCSASKSVLEKKIDESKASLELKIGTKLMNIMQRLNS